MERIQRHFIVCHITGLVTVLPIGGTILLIVYAGKSLSAADSGAVLSAWRRIALGDRPTLFFGAYTDIRDWPLALARTR